MKLFHLVGNSGSLCYCVSSKVCSYNFLLPLLLLFPQIVLFQTNWLLWVARTRQARAHSGPLFGLLPIPGLLFPQKSTFHSHPVRVLLALHLLREASSDHSILNCCLSCPFQPRHMLFPFHVLLLHTAFSLSNVLYILLVYLFCLLPTKYSHEGMGFFLFWSLLYREHLNSACL